jgi:hypothetical protein
MKKLFQILTKNNQFFYEYPNEDDEEHIFFIASLEPRSMVPVYDNYEYDPWESLGGEKEELNV